MVGNQIIKLSSVDSTNNYTAKLVKETKISFGTVIMADFQTHGKGQRSSFWESDKGLNLLISIYFDSSFLNSENIFFLSKAVALAIRKCVEKVIGNKVSIKWPNDILINGSKIAGVLIENQWKNEKLSSSIIGIGLNVNQVVFSGDNNVISLKNLTSKVYKLNSILKSLCSSLDTQFNRLRNFDFFEIDRQYHSFLFNYNQWSNYKTNKIYFKAKLIKVDSFGKMILELENGDEKSFEIKEVSLLK
jgi:BirA family transcriptional regulator, biotin operon repressor / biotin---[acetyl-CoA-carboxylase] ligase